jgi:pyruvate dehydrogenase E2 component (dihydrolipoamide acetyltransferase)
MATPVIIPKAGNTVESVILIAWKRQVGDSVRAGEAIADAETDKAVVEVTSPVDGVVLAHLYQMGAEIPVMTPIAVVGLAGETVDLQSVASRVPAMNDMPRSDAGAQAQRISPRARKLAAEQPIDVRGIIGTGAEGRIIERDIRMALESRPPMTRAARSSSAASAPPTVGSGIGGRVTLSDLEQPPAQSDRPREFGDDGQYSHMRPGSGRERSIAEIDGEYEEVPLRGIRRVIAERMRASLSNSAQVTLNRTADARVLQAYRQRLKAAPPELGLNEITISDMILYATARILTQFRAVNATLVDGIWRQYADVHLGFAVDTPRGLLVPVMRHAHRLTLKALSEQAKRLIAACQDGSITPDELNGGTFTVSNLGSLGIESFTPVISPPQVAILGVGSIALKAVERDGQVEHVPHVHLSLTIDHQVIDGAPGARFLSALTTALGQIDIVTAG